jgi:hypothetical protein
MKISSTKWAATALVLALGLPVSGASAAAPGLSAPPPAPPRVIVWRGHERRAIDHARRDAWRDSSRDSWRERRDERVGRGAESSAYDAAPSAYDAAPEEAPAPLPAPIALCPPSAAPAYRSTGPRIIEIGARDTAAPPGGWPVVIYGDYFR